MKAIVMLLLVPAVLQAQAAAPRQVPLDEAVRLARRNAPAVVQARNTVRQNSATVRSSYAAFLPSISASSGASRSEGQAVGPSGALVPIVRPWGGSHGLSASLELFDAGRRYFELRAAQANVDAAEAAEVSQEFTIALNVKQQYFNVLAARESESAAVKQLEAAEQQLRAATARVAAGAATRSDSLRSSIAVGNARLAMLEAQNQLAAANASLSRLIGSTEIVTAVVSDTGFTDAIPLGDDELLALAEQGPGVKQAQAAAAAAKQASRSSKTPYLPTISMSFSTNYNSGSDDFQLWGDPQNYQYSTSIRVNFPLFNGLNRENNVLRARITEDNAQASLRDARLNQRQQLVTFLGNFRTAEARVQIQQASVRAAEEDLRVMQERYNLGASTLLELLNSQTTLDQARTALIQARTQARTAKAQIEQLIGRDL
jgi:outer membrane protein